MKKVIFLTLIIFCSISGAIAQKDKKDNKIGAADVDKTKTDKEALDLANSVITAHGGEKFTNMKTLIVSGAVDITMSAFSQTIPATFVTIFSGNRYRIEINNPFTPFKQVYDGRETSSTLKGNFTLPPLDRQGFQLLIHVGNKDFTVSGLPADKKKKKGFRIVSPEGFYTDYFVDEKTNQIKSYEASYEVNDRTLTTSVEIDKYRTVDGAILPEKYAQRFDTEQMTIYASFKAKDISINKDVADDVFTLSETKKQ